MITGSDIIFKYNSQSGDVKNFKTLAETIDEALSGYAEKVKNLEAALEDTKLPIPLGGYQPIETNNKNAIPPKAE